MSRCVNPTHVGVPAQHHINKQFYNCVKLILPSRNLADMCFRCLNKTFGQIPVRRDANGIIRAQEAGVQTVLPTVLPELKICLLFLISRQHQAMKLLAHPAMISATSLGMRASGRCTGAHARAPSSAAACAAAAPGAGFAPPPSAAADAAAAAALGPMLRMPAMDFGGLDGSMLRLERVAVASSAPAAAASVLAWPMDR